MTKCKSCGSITGDPGIEYCPQCGAPLFASAVFERTDEVVIVNAPHTPMPELAGALGGLDHLETDVESWEDTQEMVRQAAPPARVDEEARTTVMVERRDEARPSSRRDDARPSAKRDEVRLAVVLGRVLVTRYCFQSSVISIGRDPSQDVVLDNPSVSRVHCKIRHRGGGEFVLEDMGTPNGTLVNRREVRRAELRPGDKIGISKFLILFQPSPEQLAYLESRSRLSSSPKPEEVQETQFLSLDDRDLVRRVQSEERRAHIKKVYSGGRLGPRISLRKDSIVLGRSDAAQIPLQGWFISPRHAVIVNVGGRFKLIRMGGLRPVMVNGRAVREQFLRTNDLIQIGGNSFRFFDAV
jgi:pSer/pThr/pTyr-binding forkhead associated (FHA) protein